MVRTPVGRWGVPDIDLFERCFHPESTVPVPDFPIVHSFRPEHPVPIIGVCRLSDKRSVPVKPSMYEAPVFLINMIGFLAAEKLPVRRRYIGGIQGSLIAASRRKTDTIAPGTPKVGHNGILSSMVPIMRMEIGLDEFPKPDVMVPSDCIRFSISNSSSTHW